MSWKEFERTRKKEKWIARVLRRTPRLLPASDHPLHEGLDARLAAWFEEKKHRGARSIRRALKRYARYTHESREIRAGARRAVPHVSTKNHRNSKKKKRRKFERLARLHRRSVLRDLGLVYHRRVSSRVSHVFRNFLESLESLSRWLPLRVRKRAVHSTERRSPRTSLLSQNSSGSKPRPTRPRRAGRFGLGEGCCFDREDRTSAVDPVLGSPRTRITHSQNPNGPRNGRP